MSKFLSEITFKRSFETYTETSVHKLLLPFEYAKAFCDFINPQGALDFADFFEDDLEFQEIIFEAYGDIDEDDFETEVEYLKENCRKNPGLMREIFDIFMTEGKIEHSNSPVLNEKLKKEVAVLRDLTGRNNEFFTVLL